MKYFFLTQLFFSTLLFSQDKKIIDHTVYNAWKKIGETQISTFGNYSSYTIQPHRGDGYLYIVNNKVGKIDSFFRAEKAVFSYSEKFVVFKITPGFDTLRNCELKKIKKEKWPKDSLGIYFLGKDSLVKIPAIKSFSLHETEDWLYYFSENKPKVAPTPKKKFFSFKKVKPQTKIESDGKTLVVLNPLLKKEKRWNYITEAQFSKSDAGLVFTEHVKHKADSFQVISTSLNLLNEERFKPKFTKIEQLNPSEKQAKFLFTACLDTLKEAPVFSLYELDLSQKTLVKLIDSVQTSKTLTVSPHFKPYYSENQQKIYFGMAEKPEILKKDSLLDSEKVKLDVWHWKDDRLQPQQLYELKRDQKESFQFVYDVAKKESIQLGNDTLKTRILTKGNADYALAWSVKPYQHAYNWEFPNKRDYYRVNIQTGDAEILKKEIVYQASLSTDGEYFYYFNATDTNQYVLTVKTGNSTCITCSEKKITWLEDVNGMPHIPAPYGIAAWTKESNIILESKYDIWEYQVKTNTLISLTNKDGEKNKERIKMNFWHIDSLFFDLESVYLTSFIEKDKSMKILKPFEFQGVWSLAQLHHSNHDIYGLKKAKKSIDMIFQQSSAIDYPDLHSYRYSSENRFLPKRISNTNPQQKEYNWVDVELVSWKSYNGIDLEGLLYKPENFDSTKNYPLLVYFYELYSDDLHKHYSPRPTASIIFPTEYASAGYVVFIPDVRYKPGYPAKGAYDCIMSGTDFVLKKYSNIDSTRMGLQGQSWGGYQTAMLITMTNRYKAAMAGAPVSNMFSAYGGIRWGSGLNRQFQYEKTQSRIGKTIWEAPELYVENSPQFHLPKVKTPLLIMHNDADGAVPWYQGIELFTGLKRLGKPVWMLNYNDDDHNLMKNANRMDLSIRMRQFFDYYLNNGVEPLWLKDGVPAMKKSDINYK